MKIAILLIFFTSRILMADEAFHAEETFKTPAKIPLAITSQLFKSLGKNAISACQHNKKNHLFEAQLVSLNQATHAYLVKPADMCLCNDNHCPMWMFKMKGSAAKRIWSIPATATLEILDKHLNGYKRVKEMSALNTHGGESIWAWDSGQYTEIYKNVWTLDADQKCRLGEETTQLMDGKMVEHTIQCTQD